MLFNHTLTLVQKSDAMKRFGVDRFVSLPDELQYIWSQIPAEEESLEERLAPLWEWLVSNVKEGDVALVQGDFGATCLAVRRLKALGVACCYATTIRKAIERQRDDKVFKESVFEHIRFRLYE